MTRATTHRLAVLIAGWLLAGMASVGCGEGGELGARQARAEATVEAAAIGSRAPTPNAASAREEPSTAVRSGPAIGDVVVVDRTPGPDYGRVAIIAADGSRRHMDRSCLRVHVAGEVGVCLTGRDHNSAAAKTDETTETWETVVFDATDDRAAKIRSYQSPFPSRARVRADGSRYTTTGFVNGREYEEIGATETTQTLALIDDPTGAGPMVGLSQFHVDGSARRYTTDRFQYWGVSFGDQDRFWVTGYFDDETGPEIMIGDVATMTLEPAGHFGSCPSVSPDGATVVFKKTRAAGGFVLVALDIESGTETVVGETRSVNDQVEWIDNDTIIYALHPDEGPGAEEVEDEQERYDLWTVDLAPGSVPVLFATNASSPAVVRSQ